MIYAIADNIISPLGGTTAENLAAVRAGRSALRVYADRFEAVEPFCASLFSAEQREMTRQLEEQGYSFFEGLCIRSAQAALVDCEGIEKEGDTVFVLSTTKGNVERLRTGGDVLLCESARKIAQYFGNENEPIVVSNACISGVCALITASRLLERGRYRRAVVIGCDVQSQFIVSGFQSFKALSAEACKPFDKERKGLNLGEAAATVVLTRDVTEGALFVLTAGGVHNDANHISGPSRTGEGSYRCLRDVTKDGETTDLVLNVHGTATAYNDEMESIAIARAGLQDCAVNALKGYYGHTMGAAGVMETILTAHALREGIVLATRGFEEQGTSELVRVSAEERRTGSKEFVKLLSGFGGCNAALRGSVDVENVTPTVGIQARDVRAVAEVEITLEKVVLNGNEIETTERGERLLVELYRRFVGDYPKFFKMDALSRLGFVASELLLGSVKEERFVKRSDRAIVFANRSSSLKNDTDYEATICDKENYFPSPSLFVYTLPNIVTGEIAIRNGWYGETEFYVLETARQLPDLVQNALMQRGTRSVLAGWVECSEKDRFLCSLKLFNN